MRRSVLLLLIGGITALGFATTAEAATLSPTRFDDPSGAGSCPTSCSLRQAIGFAQSGDTIQLGAGTYTLSQGTPLTVPATILSITGVSSRATTIDGDQTSGVLDNSGLLVLTDLKITHGRGQQFGGVQNLGTMGMSRVTVTANVAIGNGAITGGGIGNSGTLVLNRSAVLHNEARSLDGSDAYGAGLMVFSSGQTTIVNSTFFDNFTTTSSSSGGGGAMYVAVGASADVYNSTFVGNMSTTNQAGGQLRADPGSVMILRNNIIAGGGGQTGAQNCLNLGTVTSAGGNVESTTPSQCSLAAITGDLIGVDPQVGSLGDNGGPTDSFMLGPGSPVIGTGVLSTCQNSSAAVAGTDQRGGRRIVAGKCDPGATQSNSLANLALAGSISAPGFGKPVAYSLTLTNNGPDAVLGAAVAGTSCTTGFLAVGASISCAGTFTWDGASQIARTFSVSGEFNDPLVGGGQLTLTALSPRFTSLRLKPSKLTPTAKGGVLAVARAKGGAKVTFKSVDVAAVSAQVQRPTRGFLKSGECKPRSGKNSSGKRCTFWKSVGKAVSKKLKRASGTLRLTGRVGKVALARGKYRLALTPAASNRAKGAPRYLAFSVK